MMPKVYILILNYNGWSDTIECLESVFRNSYLNYQVVVIDNGSPNGSMEKIKNWSEGKQELLCPESTHPLYHLSHPLIKKPIPYVYYIREEAERGGNPEREKQLTDSQAKRNLNPNIHSSSWPGTSPTSHCPLILIQTGENLGFAGGNNVGIRCAMAKGDCNYVWLLNNDTVIEKNALTEMMSFAESDEKIAMVGSKLLFYNESNVIEAIGGSSIILKTLNSHAYFEEDKGQWDKPIEPDYITGASVLVRKHLIDRIGLLDEAYFMYVEDLDWSLKAKSEGYKLIYCYQSMIWHKKGACTGTSGNWGNFLGRKSSRPSVKKFSTTYYYNIRNRVYFAKKHFLDERLACFFIYLPFKILRLISGIYLYNDDRKLLRIKLIFKAIYDGLIGKMGKQV